MFFTNYDRLSRILSGIAACCFGSVLSAQEPVLPPIPNLEGLSQQIEVDVPPTAMEGDIESEILTRGPIHEAFAEQYVSDPEEGLIVPREPPEPIDELPPEELPEGTNVDWIPGYWAFDEDIEDYIWISGFWRDIPLGQRWVPGYWVEVEQGYQWVGGFWTSSEDEQLSYLPTPPESLEQGPNIAAPGDNYFWVPGTWKYESDNYRWRPGYWAPSYNDFVWMPARYQWTPRGYVHCTGYWDYPVARRGVLFSPVRFQNRRFPRRFRGYRYQPRFTVAAGPLLIHLFSRPRYRHYYYGDYYAAKYRQRGIVPFTSINRLSSRGLRYDPLAAYYQAGSRRTTFDRLVGWNSYFNRRADVRPPRTFTETRNFARTRNRDVDQVVINQSILSVSIDELKKPKGQDHKQFRVLTDDDRNRVSRESLATIRKLTDQRIQFESKSHRGDRTRNRSNIGDLDQDRRDRVESLKLPEIVSLGSKLRTRITTDADNNSRGSRLEGLTDRNSRGADRGSRSQLELLKEQIEQNRRADRDSKSVVRKADDVSRNRNSSNSNLSESIRERIEAARQRKNPSDRRGSMSNNNEDQKINGKENDPRSQNGERILGANRNPPQPQSTDDSTKTRGDRSSQNPDMRNRTSSGAPMAESIRERLEAARQRLNSSTDPRRNPESRGKQVEQRPSSKESKSQITIPSKDSGRENRASSGSTLSNSIRERLEAARQRQNSSVDPRKTIQSRGTLTTPKAAPTETKNRLSSPKSGSDGRTQTPSNSFSASSLRERIEAARQRRDSSGKSSISPSRERSTTNEKSSRSSLQNQIIEQRKSIVQPRSTLKETKSNNDSRQRQPDIKSRPTRPQTSSSSKLQNDARQRIEAAGKASEAQRKRDASSSSSKSSRSNDIRSRIQQSQSRDSSSSRKAIQDAMNRARQEAAKRVQQQSSKRESSSGRSTSPSSRSKSSSSIRSTIESRRSSSSSSRERPTRGSDKSKGKRK